MISGSWCLVERRSNRWVFHRRKQVLGTPLLAAATLLVLSAPAWLGWF
jgi:hypothetical protein